MKTTTTARKSALESALSRIAGCDLEITIRSANKFTLSAEGDTMDAIEKAKRFLEVSQRIGDWSANYDEEVDMTFAYFTAA